MPSQAEPKDGSSRNGGTMAQTGTGQIGYRVFGIYLNDHLAGATVGTELAHRVARTHREQGPGGQLKRLAAEVAQGSRAGRGESRAGEIQLLLSTASAGHRTCG
jgi:hypothetical protein